MEYTEKQLQIIEAAQKLFAANGFEGTSVRDIARDAEVNIAMISYYFGSKEKLLEAVFEKHSAFIRLQLEALVENADLTPSEKIERLVDTYLDKYFARQTFHKLIAREQMMSKESPVNTFLHQMKKTNQELVKKIIEDGQQKGVFTQSVDIPFIMATMVGTANQVVTTQHFYREINNLQDMPEEDFQLYLRNKLSIHLKLIFKTILTHEI